MAQYVVDLKKDFEKAVEQAARKKGVTKNDLILRAIATYVVDELESDPGNDTAGKQEVKRELAVTN